MEIFIMGKNMVWVFWSTTMEGSMKVSGFLTAKKDLGPRNSQMAVFSKDSISMENPMELELISGEMDRDTMVNGWMASNMVQVCGEVKKEILLKDNGNLGNLMDMECIPGPMETPMKVSSKIVLNMEKEYKDLQMEIYIKDTTSTENLQDMDNISGLMAAFSKEIL